MREADKSYLWCTEAWFRTKPGITPRTSYVFCLHSYEYDTFVTTCNWLAYSIFRTKMWLPFDLNCAVNCRVRTSATKETNTEVSASNFRLSVLHMRINSVTTMQLLLDKIK